MDIHAVKKHTFAVYLDRTDLRNNGIDPACVTYGEVRGIIEPLIYPGCTGTVRLELFPGRDDLLIFVMQERGLPLFFKFKTSEELVSSVCEYRGNETSALYRMGNCYILLIWCYESVNPFFAEFGEPLDMSPEYISHLEEHGKVLIEADALNMIRSAFSRRS